MLCDALRGIFRSLSILTSDTTAAGLRQKIAQHAYAVIVDEVDKHDKDALREQKKILKMIRSASRTGASALRGSANQHAAESSLQHIFWLAGIAINYDDAADRNRAVCVNLLPPLEEKSGKLVLPPVDEMADLGQRSLAVALWAARNGAARLAVALKDQRPSGADPRLVESYSVPAAMLATVLPNDFEGKSLLAAMLADCQEGGVVESDEQNLIASILAAEVRVSSGHALTVGQVLELLTDPNGNCKNDWQKALQRYGIKRDVVDRGNGPLVWFIFFNAAMVRRQLLRGTRFESQPLGIYFSRLPGHEHTRRRIAGVNGAVDMLPWDAFADQYMGQKTPHTNHCPIVPVYSRSILPHIVSTR